MSSVVRLRFPLSSHLTCPTNVTAHSRDKVHAEFRVERCLIIAAKHFAALLRVAVATKNSAPDSNTGRISVALVPTSLKLHVVSEVVRETRGAGGLVGQGGGNAAQHGAQGCATLGPLKTRSCRDRRLGRLIALLVDSIGAPPTRALPPNRPIRTSRIRPDSIPKIA